MRNFHSTNKPIFDKFFCMKIIVLASNEQRDELLLKKKSDNFELCFAKNFSEVLQSEDANACFILLEKFNYDELTQLKNKPVFINSVTNTLQDLKLPDNICRINGWNGFLQRDKWEVATNDEQMVKDILEKANWNYVIVKDEPGLISARIIAMIINEAYFALGENVSMKEEIDIAMKLGTNYPYGPFEWAEKMGLKNIYDLLNRLNKNNDRYNIAPAMLTEIKSTAK